jgi:putative endonuclease
MIRCANGSLYTGITTDVYRRFQEHQNSNTKAAKYLKGKGPLSLVWHHPVPDRAHASKLEHTIKQLSKIDKERIIQGTLSLTT